MPFPAEKSGHGGLSPQLCQEVKIGESRSNRALGKKTKPYLKIRV
jgi:hypothetical protein